MPTDYMTLQIASKSGSVGTMRTFVRLLSGMGPYMPNGISVRFEKLWAHWTRVKFRSINPRLTRL